MVIGRHGDAGVIEAADRAEPDPGRKEILVVVLAARLRPVAERKLGRARPTVSSRIAA